MKYVPVDWNIDHRRSKKKSSLGGPTLKKCIVKTLHCILLALAFISCVSSDGTRFDHKASFSKLCDLGSATIGSHVFHPQSTNCPFKNYVMQLEEGDGISVELPNSIGFNALQSLKCKYCVT